MATREALVKPNPESVFYGFSRITSDGVLAVDGELHKLDVLMGATRFKVAFRPGLWVINAAEKTVDEDCEEGGVNLCLGVSPPRFSNY